MCYKRTVVLLLLLAQTSFYLPNMKNNNGYKVHVSQAGTFKTLTAHHENHLPLVVDGC